MADKNAYKVGDKIVRHSRMWKIFKIKKQKDADGKEQEIIYYKPVFPVKRIISRFPDNIVGENCGVVCQTKIFY